MSLFVLIGSVVLLFAAVMVWAIVFQPRAERSAAKAAPDSFGPKDFRAYQVVPGQKFADLEYSLRDASGRELGRCFGFDRKSAQLECDGQKAALYIQGALVGGSDYAGKVGGTANDSIVIRTPDRLIAEIWRTRNFPACTYRCVYGGKTYWIQAGGLWPTTPGTVTLDGSQVGVYRRRSLAARNLDLAFRADVGDELKMCIFAICILR
jgi:hypothetical protein